MQDLAPILIASPVKRSGTTLMQRLLCSSPDAIIFGETCANELISAVEMSLIKQSILLGHARSNDEKLKAVLNGEVNHWIPDLYPPLRDWIDQVKAGYFKPIRFLKDFAESNGRGHWGVKLPEWDPRQLLRTMKSLPQAKLIYIIRNIDDTVRSAKNIGMIPNLMPEEHFRQVGEHHSQAAKKLLNPKRTLLVDYDQWISEPAKWITDIERFSNIGSIDPSVMDIKINTEEGYKSYTS